MKPYVRVQSMWTFFCTVFIICSQAHYSWRCPLNSYRDQMQECNECSIAVTRSMQIQSSKANIQYRSLTDNSLALLRRWHDLFGAINHLLATNVCRITALPIVQSVIGNALTLFAFLPLNFLLNISECNLKSNKLFEADQLSRTHYEI